MSDWEEELFGGYDYGHEEYGYDEYGEGEDYDYGDEDRDEYDEYDEYGEGDYGDGTSSPAKGSLDVVFGESRGDWGRVGQVGRQGGTVLTSKKMRDPRSVSLDQARGILEDVYYKFSEGEKDDAYVIIEKIPEREFAMMNIEILTAAALCYITRTSLGIKKFVETTKNINVLDLIRYLRRVTELQ